MRYSFTGKNITVSDALKERTTKKIDRMDRLFPEDTEVFVTFSVVKLVNKVEITIPLNKRVLRAEVEAEDMYSAIDEIVDKLEKQMVKYKNRLKDKSRRDNSFKEELKFAFPTVEEESTDSGSEIKIEKIKRFDLKPMDTEEAVMEMELLGHNFYVFKDGRTDEINVVYKRKNGTYGLIEPE